MMTKTNKKSSAMARVALGATAVLAIAGQAHAADFATSIGAGGDCTTLLFHDTTAVSAGAGGAPAGSNIAAAVAAPGGAVPPTDFDDCQTAPGFYLVAAAGADDDTNLKVARAPLGWYAAGGQNLISGTAVNVLAAALVSANSGATITECATTFDVTAAYVTTAAVAKSAATDCQTAAGHTVVTPIAASNNAMIVIDQTKAGLYNPGAIQLTTATAYQGDVACATTFSSAIAGSVTSAVGSVNSNACETVAGYEIATAQSGGVASTVVTRMVAAGSYNVGGDPLYNSAVGANTVNCVTTAALAISASVTSAAGSSADTDCVTKPGYYKAVNTGAIATAKTAISPANTYAVGGNAIKTGTAQPTACPFAGTSASGSGALTDCTPDCSTTYSTSGAVAVGGTCVCAAGYYGAPTGSPASGGCFKCSAHFTGAIAAGVSSVQGASTGASDCTTAPGYTVNGWANSDDTSVTVTQAPANSYFPGGTILDTANAFDQKEVAIQCPAHSTSAAGSSAISDCKCAAGYVSTASSCSPCAGRAAGDSVGTANTCAATATTPAAATPGAPGAPGAPAASGSSSTSVFAAVAAIAAAQLAF